MTEKWSKKWNGKWGAEYLGRELQEPACSVMWKETMGTEGAYKGKDMYTLSEETNGGPSTVEEWQY